MSARVRAACRRVTGALVATVVAIPLVMVAGPVAALNPAKVGPVDPQQLGFPAYYTDNAGVSLQMCDDGTIACLLARPGHLAARPAGEALYWAAFGSLVGPGINLEVEFALEAAWLNGEQVVFDRLRVRGHVRRAGRYVLLHPYGRKVIRAGSPSEDRNVNFTRDIGCEPAPGTQCNFKQLITSPGRITTWLRSVSRPLGYLGNPEARTRVLGGKRQFMRIRGPAGTVTTKRFGVLGKVAHPHAASLPRTLDFGNVRRTTDRRLRLLNIGTRPLTVRSLSFAGKGTLRPYLVGSRCASRLVLQVGQSCYVGIRYRAGDWRQSAATLRITDDHFTRSVRITARTTALVSARKRLRFAQRPAGTSSRKRRVFVENTGVAPLNIRRIRIKGRARHSFERRSGTPRVCERGVRLRPGGVCAVYIAFEPPTVGTKRARLILRTNALGSPHRVWLTGRAR